MMGNYFLFTIGEWDMALPLDQVRQVVESTRLAFPGNVKNSNGIEQIKFGAEVINLLNRGLYGKRDAVGHTPEALAVVEEKGLTGGILIDNIIGIENVDAVRMYQLPDPLSKLRADFGGLVEVDDKLYLLLDIERALRKCFSKPLDEPHKGKNFSQNKAENDTIL